MIAHVTHHAVVRFAERVQGLDPERLTAVDIAAINLHIAIVTARGIAAGAGAVVVDGCRYVIEGGHVVTVLTHRRRSEDRIRRRCHHRIAYAERGAS